MNVCEHTEKMAPLELPGEETGRKENWMGWGEKGKKVVI
jgi:hypothetical protein